ncbi:Sialic acid transporter NanT [Sporomusa silvacetica DSM 10669]|uniref:Sialic acid transporter NanT n=1 Tax=Sporomusa silvacetica DSM 10669 TaxID=1123289 RepID=A0ABZ3IM45_9FIRM|nr:MFS transporter [Sporomusa silvacetica]OZC15749.1 putative niacin/nicotinamide transporter NaiP [Sporomusa silvacetica DSM 10669]
MELQSKQNLFSGDDEATWKRRWKVMYASIAGYAMDGLDMLILSFVMTAIIKEFGLSFVDAGLIATYTLIGAVMGGYIFGIMADYVGRVKVFALSIILFSIFTGLCAVASSLTELNIYRFLSGLGLGGEFGIGMTLVAETWPAAKRARATAGVAIGWQLGCSTGRRSRRYGSTAFRLERSFCHWRVTSLICCLGTARTS